MSTAKMLLTLWGTALLSLPLTAVSSASVPAEGQAVACQDKPGKVYRYTQGKRRWYPEPMIADSWDPSWGQNIVMISCDEVPEGPIMKFNQPDIPEGSPIKCRGVDDGRVFRYENEQRRWYENPTVAASWDPNYQTHLQQVECISIPQGSNMPYNPAKLPEGHAIKCGVAEPEVYRFSKGKRFAYTHPIIASSYDKHWSDFFVTNCSGIPEGDALKYKQPTPIPEGKSIKCSADDPHVFRYMNGTRWYYPSPKIATSWDPSWHEYRVVECISIPKAGNLILYSKSLLENQSIKCGLNEPEVYRYSKGERHWYPNPLIATSWNPNWGSVILTDCSNIPRGVDLQFNQSLIPEGQSIRCQQNQTRVYRYTNGERREYPDEKTAESWEQDAWSNSRTVECVSIPEGPKMLYNPENLKEGQTLWCLDMANLLEDSSETSSVVGQYYRYSRGERRFYPNMTILQSYDPKYETSSVLTDCFMIPQGEDMTPKE